LLVAARDPIALVLVDAASFSKICLTPRKWLAQHIMKHQEVGRSKYDEKHTLYIHHIDGMFLLPKLLQV
jgi:hypothetical protein